MNPITTALLAQLRHANPNQRSNAALSLGRGDDAEGLRLLVDALQVETDVAVREDITYALAQRGEASVPLLEALLTDAHAPTRRHAAHVLGKIGHSSAVPALTAVLGDEDVVVVTKVIFVLQQIGDTDAVPALVGLLGTDDLEIQGTLTTALAAFGVDAVPSLAEAARHERLEVREQAVDVLGTIAEPVVVPVLVEALQDPDWQVRFASVSALGQVADDTARDALVSAQSDTDPKVRAVAKRLLADS